jgi:hypothetical protein
MSSQQAFLGQDPSFYAYSQGSQQSYYLPQQRSSQQVNFSLFCSLALSLLISLFYLFFTPVDRFGLFSKSTTIDVSIMAIIAIATERDNTPSRLSSFGRCVVVFFPLPVCCE